MRTVDLGRTAAQAEVLRLRRLIRRQVWRAVWAVVAVVFVIAVLVMVHVVAYMLLASVLPPIGAAAIVLAFDLVVTALFAVLALRGAPDRVETEAKAIRDQALSEMKESLAITALLSPLTRVAIRSAGRKNLVGMTLAALATTFMAKSRPKDRR